MAPLSSKILSGMRSSIVRLMATPVSQKIVPFNARMVEYCSPNHGVAYGMHSQATEQYAPGGKAVGRGILYIIKDLLLMQRVPADVFFCLAETEEAN